jgi:hypothetical protein
VLRDHITDAREGISLLALSKRRNIDAAQTMGIRYRLRQLTPKLVTVKELFDTAKLGHYGMKAPRVGRFYEDGSSRVLLIS